MIQINNLRLSFGTQTLYEDVTLYVGNKEKIGLIGPNGSGKTSLFKIILKEIEPDEGTVRIKNNIKIGYIPQKFKYSGDKNAIEEILSDFEEKERIKHKAEKILNKFEFTEKDMQKKMNILSYGYKMKVMLTKLLLQQPDVLLLDEPTNYLDIQSIEFLQDYLKNFKKSYIVITHDRYFLNKMVDKIWSIEDKTIRTYKGNYSAYLIERKKRVELLKKKYEEQQEFIKKTRIFIEKNRANKKTAGMAKSREKMLDKIEKIELPHELRSISFKFPENTGISGKVVELRDASVKYNGEEILKNLTLLITGGEKIAVFGANGAGKTTLLKLIAGFEKPSKGYVWRSQKLKISFYQQGQEEKLNENKTIIEEIYDSVPEWDLQDVRNILGNFLFSGDSVYKKIKSLSGGEKTKIAIIKSLLKPSNFLILDEPANHLDIQTRKVLETAVKEYKNTVIFVSHDRYMIDNLADKTIKVVDGEIEIYHGNYSYYIEKSKNLPQREELDEKQEIREKIKEKEKILKEIEKDIEETRKNLDIVKARELHFEYKMIKKEIEELQLLIKE